MALSSTSGNGDANARSTDDVEFRLRELEARLLRIEASLGLTPPIDANVTFAPEVDERGYPIDVAAPRSSDVARLAPLAPPEPPSTEQTRARPAAFGPSEIAPPPLPQPFPQPQRRYGMAEARVPELTPDAAPAALMTPAPPASVLAYSRPQTQPPPSPVKRGSLEQTIGLKWAGWVGAVVLVIGAAFGVKFVYEQRWLAAVPPAVWLSMIAAAGLALIGAGEFVYGKVSQIPAASLFGAGIATLFLAAYVGHAYWKLYPPPTAFWLMAATTIIGSAVSVRARLVSTAILSLLGGAIAPALLGDPNAPVVSFLAYLMTLQVVALALAWWGGRPKWWILRGLSLAITATWFGVVLAGPHRTELAPLVFVLLSAVLYHAETILSAARAERTSTLLAPRRIGAVFVTLATAGLIAALLWITQDAGATAGTMWVVGVAFVAAVLAVQLHRSNRRLWMALAVSYEVQAVALLALAVPVYASGVRVEIGWAMLAIALAGVGRGVRSKVAQVGAIAAWVLAIAHVKYLAAMGDEPVWLTVLGADVRSTAVMAWTIALAGHVVAALLLSSLREPRDPRDGVRGDIDRAAVYLSGVATLVWVITSLWYLPPLGATAWIVAYAWLVCGLDRLVPALALNRQVPALITFAAVKWVASDTLMQGLSPGWSATQYRPVLNPVAGLGLAIAASGVAARWLVRPLPQISQGISPSSGTPGEGRGGGQRGTGASVLLWTLAAFLIAWAGTTEIDRAVWAAGTTRVLGWPAFQVELMGWTIWWSVIAAAGAIVLSRFADPLMPGRRQLIGAANGLLVALAIKFLILDTVFFRIFAGVRPGISVMLNIQAATAAVLCAAMLVAQRMSGDADRVSGTRRAAPGAAVVPVLSALVLLWAGSLEVDRAMEQSWAFAAFAQPALAKQVALSVFWSLFAIAAVVIGFPLRLAGLRYLGLILFAVTLLKVVTIDMGSVSTGYRILSFIGLGGLMLGTSVLYGKLSPALLREA